MSRNGVFQVTVERSSCQITQSFFSARSFESKFFVLGLRLRPGIEKTLLLYRVFSSMVKVSRAWCKELAAKMNTIRVFFGKKSKIVHNIEVSKTHFFTDHQSASATFFFHRNKATLKMRYKNFGCFFYNTSLKVNHSKFFPKLVVFCFTIQPLEKFFSMCLENFNNCK